MDYKKLVEAKAILNISKMTVEDWGKYWEEFDKANLYKAYTERLKFLNKEINKRLHPNENWNNQEIMEEAEELMKEKQDIELTMCKLELKPVKQDFEFSTDINTYLHKDLQISRKKMLKSQGFNLYPDEWHQTENIRGLNDDILNITY